MPEQIVNWLLEQAPSVAIALGALYAVYKRQCRTEDKIQAMLADCWTKFSTHLQSEHK